MECARCHRKIGSCEAIIECPVCNAVVYCTMSCQTADLEEDQQSDHSHKYWCERFQTYLQDEHLLCDFPFTFTSESTSRFFNLENMRVLLMRYGVYKHGIWQRICEDQRGKPFIPYGDLTDVSYHLNQEEVTLGSSPPQSLQSPLTDWSGYFSWRGLSLNSPMAALLTYPLTVYYILTTCLQQDNPDVYSTVFNCDTIHIGLIGVEKEVEMLNVFQELSHLLPHMTLQVDMLGKGVSRGARGRRVVFDKLTITVHRTYYHQWEEPAPHIVIGLNAGIPAYKSWKPTIEKLREQRVPAYFTEYSQYFVDVTDKTLKTSKTGEVTRTRINPFRSPFRVSSDDNYLPWFSNCVIFSIT